MYLQTFYNNLRYKTSKDKSMNIEFIYIYDALCGWCYGYGPVTQKVQEKYGDQFKYTVLSGGMVLRERVGPISDIADYIRGALKTVEERTGVEFGMEFHAVMNEGSRIMNSMKPSEALQAYKKLSNKEPIRFAHAIQSAFYKEGKDLNQNGIYLQLAKDFGLNEGEYLLELNSIENKSATQSEFALVAQFGVTGFPMTVLKVDEEYFLVARGYADFENVDKTIQSILQEVLNKA
jgi:putative protein-disulfide isomerase